MPQASPVSAAAVSAARPDVRVAIARASQRTGVDFTYLLAQARIESGMNPQARAATSSAAGLYQFVNSTWLDTLDRHGDRHGLGWASAAIDRSGGRAVAGDRAQLPGLLALRLDPDAAATMAAELANDNAAALRPVLGREPGASELYLAHFMGAGGAIKFLNALQSDPAQSAAALFPAAAAANRPIFHEGARARSVGEVMGVLHDKVAGAMAAESGTAASASQWAYAAPPAFGARPAGHARAPAASPQPAPSMADTLRAAFGDSGHGAAATGRIAAAYARMDAFGL